MGGAGEGRRETSRDVVAGEERRCGRRLRMDLESGKVKIEGKGLDDGLILQ